MIYIFITGSSSGIGKAIAEKAIEQDKYQVTGISRNCSIHGKKSYHHLYKDLTSVQEVYGIKFDSFDTKSARKIVLINNAATVEPVSYLGNIDPGSFVKQVNLNMIAPVLLMNNFIAEFEKPDVPKLIINISSGAASHPVDGWTGYCGTKAALEMQSEVANLESGLTERDLRVFSIAPGIVDTPMQDVIRTKDESEFSRLEEFKNFKKQQLLVSPVLVAEKILDVIENTDTYKNTTFRLT